MNKLEFVDIVSNRTGLSKKDSLLTINTALDVITEVLKNKDTIGFMGFGTFGITPRTARIVRVPGTDRTVSVESRNVVKFKAGKNLKEAIKDIK